MGELIQVNKYQKKWSKLSAIMVIVFGLATIISGGKSLFTDAGNVAAGNYVPLVLWFNFFSGFLYVLAGIGLARCHDWSWRLATGIAILTILVFVYLGFHVFFGGAFENRTILAMVLRSGFWVFMARFSYLQHNLKV